MECKNASNLQLTVRFLLAKLWLDQILRLREPRKRLHAVEEMTKSIPNSLSEAYQALIGRIDEIDRDLALRIFSWLFRAQRILRMDELLEALVVEEGDRDLERECLLEPSDIIKCCNGLVLYEESSGFVRFSHETVHDYFKTNINILPTSAHLAKSCLTYLSFDVFEQPCSGRDSIEEQVRRYKFSLYAAQFWRFHVKEAEEYREVQEAVVSCFASKGRRNSMLQMKAYAKSNGRNSSFVQGKSLIHLLAETGLSATCNFVLEKGQVKEGTVYVLPFVYIDID